MTGNITMSGSQTVDGRDLSVDGSKLDGIESGATADQTNSQIAAALSDQQPSMKGALFTDDGAGTPIVNIRADDGNPWGLRIGNDGYSSSSNAGFMAYQNNNGSVDFKLSGTSAYVNWYFQQNNGSNTSNACLLYTSPSPRDH